LLTSELVQQLLAALPLGETHSPPSEFFAVPGDQPRWLIPACGGNLHSTLATWSPYRVSSRLKWGAIRVANRIGALPALPHVKTMQLGNAGEIDWRALGWDGGALPLPLVYVGTPGPSQKAVIHLVDPASGNCAAIVKVPLGAEATNAIVRDASTLGELAGEGLCCAPRLLYLDRSHGIATEQFLPGKSGSRRFLPEYLSLLGSLVLRYESTTIAEHVAAWHNALSSVTHKPYLELLQAALAELCDAHALPACWLHGDFAPWNIRHSPHCAAALIDWEDAERGGLPLQDAYHFLHMQDFLFGARPTTHCADVEPLAKTLGIAPPQCRALEIAYLFQSYLKCTSHHQPQRAGFLLKTLALLVRNLDSSTAFATKPPRRLQLVSSHPAELAGVRAQLFEALVAQLNHAEIPYCILSGYEARQEINLSDVDIMFRPRDLPRVPALLAQTAEAAGALLVQSIQHETTASYFVLARQLGKHVVHLAADCYSDYRRDGRSWLPADDVIAVRRKYRDFYVPSVADEFIYYLIKKVLKQDIVSHHLKRLQHLFARNPMDCRQRVAIIWPPETALMLQRAIVEQNLGWFQRQLSSLLAELQRSPAVERPLRRTLQELREAGRCLRRILFPTGLSVIVVGGDSALTSQLADDLACNLAPVFRRTRRIWTANSLPDSFRQILQVSAARIRSTLVARTADSPATASALPQAIGWLESLYLRARGDVVVSLEPGQSEGLLLSQIPRRRLIRLDADGPPEQVLHNAIRATLYRLSLRTGKRLGLRSLAGDLVVGNLAGRSELGSAGLD
jgi:hypothetical protein